LSAQAQIQGVAKIKEASNAPFGGFFAARGSWSGTHFARMIAFEDGRKAVRKLLPQHNLTEGK
jgi:hypothetical protein